ncbi:MAG: head-tail connector protein [Planctomycetota bacterium]
MQHQSVAITQKPETDPVSLAELKDHLRFDEFDDGSQDNLLTRLIKSATGMVELETRRALIERTLRLSLDAWPSGRGVVYLPEPPTLEVVAIDYDDVDGVAQTLATDQYQVDLNATPARIAPVDCWPETLCGVLAPIRIDLRAGFGDTRADVPDDLRHAVLLTAGHFYENREATSTTQLHAVPLAVATLLEPYRIPLV